MTDETKDNHGQKGSKETGGFKGLSKEDYEVLKKAATMYTKLTDEPVKAIGQIPVLPEEDTSAEAKAKKAEEDLKLQAEATKKVEDARQAERRVRLGIKDDEKPEPALAPLAAKAAEQATVAGTTTPAPKGKKGEPLGVKAAG